MNKLLVKVKHPLISQDYEMFIPINKTIEKITNLVQKTILEFNVDEVPIKQEAILINSSTNEILNKNKLVIESNIKNGDVLVIL